MPLLASCGTSCLLEEILFASCTVKCREEQVHYVLSMEWSRYYPHSVIASPLRVYMVAFNAVIRFSHLLAYKDDQF